MNKYTHEEIEEANYEMWIMSGGAEKAQRKHTLLAIEATTKMAAENGVKIHSQEMKRTWMGDFEVLHAVIETAAGDLKKIYWHAGNKEFFDATGKSGSFPLDLK